MRLSYRLKYNNAWHEIGSYRTDGTIQLGLVNSQNTSIDTSLFTKEGKSVTNSATFRLTWNSSNRDMYIEVMNAFLDAIDSGANIECIIANADDSTTLFSGNVDLSSLTITSGKIPASIDVKAKDYITILDEKVKANLVYEDKAINEVVRSLLVEAGAIYPADLIDSPIPYTKKLQYFVLTEDDDVTYRDVIDTLLFEFGYCIYRNPNTGKYAIHKILKTDEPSHQVHYLVSDTLKTTTGLFKYKGAEIIYPNVSTMADARLFTDDVSVSFDDKGNLVGETIEPGAFYPKDGELKASYQEFDSSYLDREYQEKRSRLQNSHIDLLYVKADTFKLNVNPSEGFDQPAVDLIGKPEGTVLYPRKAWTLLRNNTDKPINLLSFDMTGTAVYKSKLNKLVMPADATNPEEYETSYIFNETDALAFADFFVNWQNLKRTTATWTEIEKVSNVGDVVVIKHKETDIAQAYVVVEQTMKFIDRENVSYHSVGVALSGYKEYSHYEDTYVHKLKPGNVISSTDEFYYSESKTELVNGTWQATANGNDNLFLWKRTKTTYSNGKIAYSAPYFAGGQNGIGIKSTLIDYQVSDSGSEAPTGAWDDTVPTVPKGKYLWTRTITTYTDDSSYTAYSVSYFAEDGKQGPKGEDLVKEPGIKIECSHSAFQLSPRGVCKNEQSLEFNIKKTMVTDKIIWTVYKNGSEYETSEGDSITVVINVNETTNIVDVVAETKTASPKLTDATTIYGLCDGAAQPERARKGSLRAEDVKFVTTLDDGVSPLVTGDYMLVIVEQDGKDCFTAYRYENGWSALDGSESNAGQIMFALLDDGLVEPSDTQVSASIFTAWIKNLVSQQAFIENLIIQNAFKSNNYEENAEGDPIKGWKGDTATGTLKSVNMKAHGLIATDANIKGSLEHPSIKTVDGSTGKSDSFTQSTKTLWSVSDFIESLSRYKGSENTYHNIIKSGSITYNGVSYDQYYSKMWDGDKETSFSKKYTASVGKNGSVDIISTKTVQTLLSEMGISVSGNEAIRMNFHCNGATTIFRFFINGVESYSEKVDGVGVFNGWLRPSDSIKVTGKNTNIFNTRDLSCEVTAYQVGYPIYPLSTSTITSLQATQPTVPNDEDYAINYKDTDGWKVPTGFNQAWVSFNAHIYGDYNDIKAALLVDDVEVANSYTNSGMYKFNWKVAVSSGQTIKLRVYSITRYYEEENNDEYYCIASAIQCVFGKTGLSKGLYLRNSSNASEIFLKYYPATESNGWSDISYSTSLSSVSKTKIRGEDFINIAISRWGSDYMNKEIMLTGSSITINGTATSIDRIILTNNVLQYRNSSNGVWSSIVNKASMGIYDSISISITVLSALTSIETASIVPKDDSAYQIGTPAKRFNSAYIKEHHINGWRMSVSNSELTFIYEG